MNLPPEYLLIIDASSFIHRHFHTAPRNLRRQSDDLPIGALQAFSWSMMKMLLYAHNTTLGTNPSHMVTVLDVRGKNFRHEMYPDYKGQRPGYDPDLEAQLPFIRPMSEALGIQVVGVEGVEADDVIATYCDLAKFDDIPAVIASSDKDLMQMLDYNTFMYDPKKDGGREYPHHLLTSTDCLETWGVAPWQMPDLQALMGDAADNVPGVPGIGPKIAAKLIQQFGTLDAVLQNIDFIDMRGKVAEKLESGIDLALLSASLVELRRNVPVPYGIEDLRLEPFDHKTATKWLLEMGFLHLARKIDQYAGQ